MGGFFDQLSAAFENDDSLGERQDAGLKRKARFQTLTWRGPKPEGFNPFEQQPITETNAVAGQKLSVIAMQEGIPIKYSCMQGTCRICDVMVDGQVVPSCMAQVVRARRLPRPRLCPSVRAGGDDVASRSRTRAAPQPKKDITIDYGIKGTMKGRVAPNTARSRAAPQAPGGRAAPAEPERPKLNLEARLRAENEAKQAAKKGGGWPFG